MRFSKLLLSLGVFLAFTGHAQAAPIDYIFTGTGTGSLGSSNFSGDFTVSIMGDTNAVANPSPNYYTNAGVGSFSSGALSASLNAPTGVILVTDAGFPNIGFAQGQPAPVYAVDEALNSTYFETYDLSQASPLTGGNVSFAVQTYLTNNGDLTFNSISSLQFEATVSSVPLPASLPMFVLAIGTIGAFGFARRRGMNS